MSQNLASFSVSRVAAKNDWFQVSSLLSNLRQTFGASFYQIHYTTGLELIEVSVWWWWKAQRKIFMFSLSCYTVIYCALYMGQLFKSIWWIQASVEGMKLEETVIETSVLENEWLHFLYGGIRSIFIVHWIFLSLYFF